MDVPSSSDPDSVSCEYRADVSWDKIIPKENVDALAPQMLTDCRNENEVPFPCAIDKLTKTSAVIHCGEHRLSAESLVWQLEEVMFFAFDAAGHQVHQMLDAQRLRTLKEASWKWIRLTGACIPTWDRLQCIVSRMPLSIKGKLTPSNMLLYRLSCRSSRTA